MADPEGLVTAELSSQNFRCEHFSKAEMRRGKTPDRRVYRGDHFAFFLEVKEIQQDRWLGGTRPDPILNRLTDDIHSAVKQFGAVNPKREHPNVLAFVNNDRACGSLDLIGVTTGHLLLEDGAAPVYLKYSEGRIRDEKHRIDLYLWFDAFKTNQMFFNMVDQRHLECLCGYFDVDPKSIPLIGA